MNKFGGVQIMKRSNAPNAPNDRLQDAAEDSVMKDVEDARQDSDNQSIVSCY